MNYIDIEDIKITEYQREAMPWTVAEIEESMKDHGYNEAYPVVLDNENNLVDGGHRIKAAKCLGITRVPFIRKPDNGLSNIRYALVCNDDRSKGREDDVFDLAELCWRMGKKTGISYEEIAKILGWSGKSFVSAYVNIKEKIHPNILALARFTRKNDLVNQGGENVVNYVVHNCERWKESHFRPIIKYLPLISPTDHAIFRGQLSVISQCLNRWQNKPKDTKGRPLKVTAKWIEKLATKEAWNIKLKRYAADNLKSWVGIRQRIELFQNVNRGNFGDKEIQASFEQFKNAIEALNGKIPHLYIGRAENMTEIKNESIDIIITSPPYNLRRSNWKMGGEGRTHRGDTIGYDQHSDDMPEDEYQNWQIACLIEMYRVAKFGASLFYNCKVRSQNSIAIPAWQWILRDDNPWTIRQEIVWDRMSTHNHNGDFFWPEDERIYWMIKGDKPNLYNRSIGMSTSWRFHGPKPGTWHPAPFVGELPRRCLKVIGGQNLVVLDPFAGSCTTLRVALSEFGHEAIGYDISAEYLERARKENGWQQETLKTVIL
jgi:modification methylase